MKMKNICYVFVLIILYTTFLKAQIPKTINYQGLLTNINGGLVSDGEYTIDFSLYPSETGSNPLWKETKQVNVKSGIFSIILGKVNPLNIPFDKPLWLGIKIGQAEELLPRIELTSSAYSLYSQNVADSSITSQKISNGQVVRSLNSLKDNIKIAGKNNVQVTTKNDSIIISSTAVGDGGIQTIQNTDNTLNIINPDGPEVTVNIKNGGIRATQIADGSITKAKLASDALSNNGWTVTGNNMSSNVSGFVGIGSSTPVSSDEKFGIYSGGNSFSSIFVQVAGDQGRPAYGYKNGSGIGWTELAGSSQWRLVLNNQSRLLVDYASGNVGIGVNPSTSKLSVAGQIQSLSGGFKFPDGTVQTTAAQFGIKNSLDAADGNPVNAVYVDNNGNVGIGTTSPGSKLTLRNSNAEIGLQLKALNSWTAELRQTNSSLLSLINGGSERLSITASGNTGIGTTTPQEKLDVNGNAKIDGTVVASGTIKTSGELHSNKTGNANLLPLCYGLVNGDGTVQTGTGNFSVSRADAGNYTITINGENFYFLNYVVLISPVKSVIASWTSAGGKLKIYLNNTLGFGTDSNFSFVIYKP